MPQYQAEKLLKKSKLSTAYGKLDSAELQRAVLEEYEKLLDENDLSNKTLAGHMKGSILPSVAFYRVLPGRGYTKAETLRLIRTAVLDGAQPMARFFQNLGKLPFFFPLFRVMCPASMKHGFGEEGWVFVWKRNDAYAIEWDCTSCLYVNVFMRHGMPELAPIFCESDDVMYGKIPSARWGRTKTIGRGAELCNFSFYNIKKEGFQNGKNK